jgi:transglutaminase-like putative cysteine protease
MCRSRSCLPVARLAGAVLVLLVVAAGEAIALPQVTAAKSDVTFDISPAPEWVKPISVDTSKAPEAGEGGVAYLLVNRQENLATREMFFHSVQQISSENGVQSGSAITTTFDPAYQRLAFHWIRVTRNGTPMERLDRGRIQLFQREQGMESFLYDGTYTARCELEDVRVGDVVEFAYTITGANPVLRGQYTSTFTTSWSYPVRRAVVRLLYPVERQLQFRSRNREVNPVQTTTGTTKEWLLDETNVPARRVNSDSPVDHEPRGTVEVSEFRDWPAVVEWALPLFNVGAEGAPELEAEAERLRQIAARDERIVAALRFVQEEIRYVGIESGISSHQPAPPQEVLRRRFGDCKDKTLLLVTLLRRVGIDAAPALVSSEYRSTVPERLPSPHVFDHAIVQVLDGARMQWLDPTRTAQRGPLSHIFVSDFRFALPVRAGTHGVVPVKTPEESWPRRESVETFSIPAPGGTGRLDVVSVHHGAAADRMRSWLREDGREQVQRTYLQHYARRFPAVEVREPLRYEEVPEANALRILEFYTMPDIWQREENSTTWRFDVWPSEIDSVLGSVTSAQRDDPLALEHPIRVQHEIRAEMFEPWSVRIAKREVQNAFFRYQEEGTARGRHLWFSYTYESRADRVPVAELSKYNAAVRKARENMGYSLTYDGSPVVMALRRFHWLVALPFIGWMGLTSSAALIYLLVSRRRTPLAAPEPPGVEGIGGWLVVVLLWLLLRPVVATAEIAQLSPVIFDLEKWRPLTTADAAALLFALFASGTFVVVELLLLGLFLLKRAVFPRLFVIYLVVLVVCAAIEFAFSSQTPAAQRFPSAIVQLLYTATAAAILLPCLFRSRRVQATFRR